MTLKNNQSKLKLESANLLVILLVVFIAVPYFYFFPHLFINAHDNLDIDVIRYMLVARKSYIFAPNSTIIPEMMGGLPRMVFDSAFYYPVWLFYFFHPYFAVMLNLVIVHGVAFLGAYSLGKYLLYDRVVKNFLVFVLILLISINFAYYQEQHLLNLGLGIAASPWVLKSVIKIYRQEHNFWDYFVVFLFPFISRLTHTGFFWIFFGSLFLVIDFMVHKKIHYALMKALMLLILGYVVVEYRLLWGMFLEHFQSHRFEFNLMKWTLVDVRKKMWEFFWWGDYQARAMNYVVWILLSILSGMVLIKKYKIDKRDFNTIIVLLSVMVFCMIISAFSKYEKLRFLFGHLNFFDLSRFAFMLPLISLTFVFILIKVILKIGDSRVNDYKMVMVFAIVFYSLAMTIKYNHTVKDFMKQLIHIGKSEINNEHYFYLDEFYATDLFSKIKKDLPHPVKNYRAGAIGLHPALLLFNGFYTIDGAIANYPLPYKKKFREIIKNEIAERPNLKDYFDDYGCRVYLFSKDLYSSQNKTTVIFPKMNTYALKKLNCKYIFSSAKIGNADALHWQFLNVYQNKNYIIYVYEVL